MITCETGKVKRVKMIDASPKKTELRCKIKKPSTNMTEKTEKLASDRTISLIDFCLTSFDWYLTVKPS